MPSINHFDKHNFLAQYWQQQPLFVKSGFSGVADIATGDDLAGLACDETVESRIIRGNGLNHHWTCTQGPFDETSFAELPEKNWTLLVQGLDQWSEDCQQILDAFDFLPRWRLEDIMASYAPKGGGVGPHFDYYDVFLIQISGTREWQLGQYCDETTPLQDNDEVKLLKAFDASESFEASEGDLLYIPAGVAHWGMAMSDDCITLSVGFRAPSEKEIMMEVLDEVIDTLPNHRRYRDTAESIDQHPYKINTHVQENIQYLGELISAKLLKKAFAQLVTEPRYGAYEAPEIKWSIDDIQGWFSQHELLDIEHASYARFAFTASHFFANGEAFAVSETFSQQLCDKRIYKTTDATELDLLCSLLDRALIMISDH